MAWWRLFCVIVSWAVLAGGCERQDDDLTTDLHRAAGRGDLGAVQALIARGAGVNARDHEDCTPLHMAARTDEPYEPFST